LLTKEYRKVSIQDNSKHHKLKPKYYGPYEILERIRDVAYKLNLLSGSLLHPIFYVSQLKKCRGKILKTTVSLPVFNTGGKLRMEPTTILDRRIIKRKNQTVVEVLVRWSNLDDEEAICEEYESLCA
jgi:hypothetical protein